MLNVPVLYILSKELQNHTFILSLYGAVKLFGTIDILKQKLVDPGGREGHASPIPPPYKNKQARIQGARPPPLTLGFEAPKLSFFGSYLIFP